jgi:deoxyribonuclease V
MLNDGLAFQFKDWEEARVKQVELARLVVEHGPARFNPTQACGIDVAYSKESGFAAAVTFDIETSRIVEVGSSKGRVKVPYLPGFLGFREGPLTVSAARKLREPVDVFLVDGHGRVHPRRFGLACHVGLALNKPTIGVAKSSFYGRIRGDAIIGQHSEVLGRIVKARTGKPFYVSVGHLVGLDEATTLVQRLLDTHTSGLRAAHLEAGRLRRESG